MIKYTSKQGYRTWGSLFAKQSTFTSESVFRDDTRDIGVLRREGEGNRLAVWFANDFLLLLLIEWIPLELSRFLKNPYLFHIK